jgi:glycosyltransferase involved in cell wall biosynthesis
MVSKKICFVDYVARADVGWGIAKYTWYLINHLKDISKEREIEILEVSHGPVSSRFLEKALEKLLFFNRIKKIPEANLYHAVSPILALPLLMKGYKPCIVTVHDLNFFYHGRSHLQLLLESAYHKYVCEKSDAIIVIGEFWKNELVQKLGVNKEKIYVVYHGVDREKFRPMPSIPKNNKDERWVLYVRARTNAPNRRKSLELMFNAFSIVKSEMKNSKLVILGKVDESYIEALSKKFELNGSTKLLKFVPEKNLPLLYNMSDVMVSPILDEFNLMILEGMACGVPVIAGDRFETPEYVRDAAILIKRDDPKLLAESIIRVLTDSKLRDKLVKKGLDRVKYLSWKKCTVETFKVYEKYWGGVT